MSEWDALKLSDLVAVRKGKLAKLSPQPGDGFLPYLGASALEGRIDAFAEAAGAELATDNDVLMLWDGERSGLAGKGLRGVVASTVGRLTPRDGVDTVFLYHALSHKFEWIQARRTGTGVPHVPKDLCDILVVDIPRIPIEQRAIAAVLDAADEAIAKTEALIAKLKAIKQGLLHDLLTRGLDDNGELRDPDKDKSMFVKSPIGWLPKGWACSAVYGLSCTFAGGTPPRSASGMFGGGIPWVKSAEVNMRVITSTEETLTEKGYHSSSTRWVEAGTPLVAMYGATAGVVGWLAIRALTNQAVLAVPPRSSDVDARWLYWALKCFQWRLLAAIQGSGQPNLSKRTVDSLLLPVPQPEEQRQLASMMDRFEDRLIQEEFYLAKLKAIKKGLMQDLLTGRVRVPAEKIAALSTG